MKKLSKDKPRLLVISHVLPFPGDSGQQQRVRYKLQALGEQFHLTFLTVAPAQQATKISQELAHFCDEPLVLPSLYNVHPMTKVKHKVMASLYTAVTGLKSSNYLIGKVEFTAKRLAAALNTRSFKGVLYEYWHAVDSTNWFKTQQIPTILDMHNILWQSYQRQLELRRQLPALWRQWATSQYRQREELAWQHFDALIAINRAERNYVANLLPKTTLFYAPMGIDLTHWPYSWQPASSPRVAYYGGLGSLHNQQDALACYKSIMPAIWQQNPQTELWLIGSNPPESLIQLANRDKRVIVTGFVSDIQKVLSTMSLVLCPWSGTYGFRSRLVEVMALGVPVVATTEAVDGMNMINGHTILLGNSHAQLAHHAQQLLNNTSLAAAQSQNARQTIEKHYSYTSTYLCLANELGHWLASQTLKAQCT